MNLSKNSKCELKWWIYNVESSNQSFVKNRTLFWNVTVLQLVGEVFLNQRILRQGAIGLILSNNSVLMFRVKSSFSDIKTFCSTEQNKHICIPMDNMVAVNYINKQEGRKVNLNELTREIFDWYMSRKL